MQRQYRFLDVVIYEGSSLVEVVHWQREFIHVAMIDISEHISVVGEGSRKFSHNKLSHPHLTGVPVCLYVCMDTLACNA